MKKLLGTIFTVAVFFSIFCSGIQVQAKAEDRILNGIYVDGIDVSGMTAAEAKAAVEQMVAAKAATPIVLRCVNDNEVIVTPADLGMEWSNPQIIEDVSRL